MKRSLMPNSVGDDEHVPSSAADYYDETVRSEIPAASEFVLKLWNIVNCTDHEQIIGWDRPGTSFMIHDESSFVNRVMPLYFRHRNFMSFHRQLNQYGFRRKKSVRTSTTSDGCVVNIEGPITFTHPYFVRGHHEFLASITRRERENKDTNQQTIHRRLDSIELSMERLENNQRYMCSQLEFFQSAHSEFLKELKRLQIRHEKHEHLINRLISFIMNFIVTTTAKMNSSKSADAGSSAQTEASGGYLAAQQSQVTHYNGTNQNCSQYVDWVNELDAHLLNMGPTEETDRRPLAITAHGETEQSGITGNNPAWMHFDSLFNAEQNGANHDSGGGGGGDDDGAGGHDVNDEPYPY